MRTEQDYTEVAKRFLYDWGRYIRSSNDTGCGWDKENIISKIGKERDGASQATGRHEGYQDEEMEALNGIVLSMSPMKQQVLKCKFAYNYGDAKGSACIKKSKSFYRTVLEISVTYIAGIIAGQNT